MMLKPEQDQGSQATTTRARGTGTTNAAAPLISTTFISSNSRKSHSQSENANPNAISSLIVRDHAAKPDVTVVRHGPVKSSKPRSVVSSGMPGSLQQEQKLKRVKDISSANQASASSVRSQNHNNLDTRVIRHERVRVRKKEIDHERENELARDLQWKDERIKKGQKIREQQKIAKSHFPSAYFASLKTLPSRLVGSQSSSQIQTSRSVVPRKRVNESGPRFWKMHLQKLG